MRHTIDLVAVARLGSEPGVVALARSKARAVVVRAQARAPKATGAGAASIHEEEVRSPAGTEFRIGWDQEHDYMKYREFGTEHERAVPFLRPALDGETETTQ